MAHRPQGSPKKQFLTEHKLQQPMIIPVHWIKKAKISISAFCEKDEPLFLKKKIPFTQECYVPSLVEIVLVVLEKKTKNFKKSIHGQWTKAK